MTIGLAAGTIGLAVATTGCSRHAKEEPAARPVRIEEVRTEDAPAGLRYSATIQPYEQVPLAFKVGGYVSEVLQRPGPDGRLRNLQQGDAVRRGTVLARINPVDYQERVNQARAQVAEAEADLERRRSDAGRSEILYKDGALTRPELEAATAGLAMTAARAEGARAQLETSLISLRDSSLTASLDGIVLSRNIEVGSLAGVGTVGFTLADLTRVKAVFGVPDSVLSQVPLGSPLRVTTDSLGGVEFEGRVTALSPSADAQSRIFTVEVTIPNPDRRLMAGMIVSVALPSGPAEIPPGSATVPMAAVVKSARPGAFAVFVVEGPDETTIAKSRDVVLGHISGNRLGVESGLVAGERVVVSGASLLSDGDRVRVIPGTVGE